MKLFESVALVPKDKWIVHDGEPVRFSGDEEVYAIYRDGTFAGPKRAGRFRWAHENDTFDVMFYCFARPTAELEEAWQRFYDAASALEFGAYPAHGSGLVIIVSGGNVNEFKEAKAALDLLLPKDKSTGAET
jgi:hypothetical protein